MLFYYTRIIQDRPNISRIIEEGFLWEHGCIILRHQCDNFMRPFLYEYLYLFVRIPLNYIHISTVKAFCDIKSKLKKTNVIIV